MLKVGRKFVVCDAGGGTVDLISYEVAQVNRLELKEVTEGTGGKCGSSMLNMRFRRHLKQTHGDKHWSDEKLIPVLNEFESVRTLIDSPRMTQIPNGNSSRRHFRQKESH
jgi:serine/threonine-protein kinase ATR